MAEPAGRDTSSKTSAASPFARERRARHNRCSFSCFDTPDRGNGGVNLGRLVWWALPVRSGADPSALPGAGERAPKQCASCFGGAGVWRRGNLFHSSIELTRVIVDSSTKSAAAPRDSQSGWLRKTFCERFSTEFAGLGS
jgi:hypothetical protein